MLIVRLQLLTTILSSMLFCLHVNYIAMVVKSLEQKVEVA